MKNRRYVALKRVLGGTKELRHRFRQEGRLQQKLDHPAVARCHGVEQVGKADLIVMEFIDGETLSRHVRRTAESGSTVNWRRALDWTVQALQALEYVHGNRIIHRDIKPGNLMLVGAGDRTKVKLLDLGLAKDLEPAVGGELTVDGQVLGTRDYLPPEQIADCKNATAASDIYGLGATLFFVLTGRPPYATENLYQLIRAHQSGRVPSVLPDRPDVPAAVDRIVQRMLSIDPIRRGSARELRCELARVSAAPAGAARSRSASPVVAGGSAGSYADVPMPCPGGRDPAGPAGSVGSGPVSDAESPRRPTAPATQVGGETSLAFLLKEMTSEVVRGLRELVGVAPKTPSVFRATPGERLAELWGDCRGPLSELLWTVTKLLAVSAALVAVILIAGRYRPT